MHKKITQAALLATALIVVPNQHAEAVIKTSTPVKTTVSVVKTKPPYTSPTVKEIEKIKQTLLMKENKRNNIVKLAASKKGLPYKWGGTSPTKGFDCSGFTQWLYKKNGINIPRTTTGQIRIGKSVPLKSAKPGDLIFTSGGDHVGVIATHGGKTMWHSPHAGDRIKLTPVKYMKVKKVVRVIV